MNDRYLFRAKRTDNGEWVEGYIFRLKTTTAKYKNKDRYFIFTGEFDVTGLFPNFVRYEVDPSTICKCTGKEYMDSDIAYEGDIFESQVSGDLMILRYGTYQAYCPADKCYMDSVGFYAECKGYPDMPIGDLQEYAIKRGNIFDNPELLEVGE